MRPVVYAVVAAAVLGAGATAEQAAEPAKPAAKTARLASPQTPQTTTPTTASSTPAPGKMAAAHAVPAGTTEAQTKLVAQYCAGCHSEKGKAGGLTLAGF